MKIPIGVIIKSIIDEKRLKVVDVAEKMGLTRAAVYQSYAKQEMSESEIQRWTDAIGVQDGEILNRRAAMAKGGSETANTADNSYLLDHLARIEETFKESLKQLQAQIDIKDRQLETKDEQMRGLQKTVDVLLGKSEGVASLLTTLNQAIPKLAKKAAATA